MDVVRTSATVHADHRCDLPRHSGPLHSLSPSPATDEQRDRQRRRDDNPRARCCNDDDRDAPQNCPGHDLDGARELRDHHLDEHAGDCSVDDDDSFEFEHDVGYLCWEHVYDVAIDDYSINDYSINDDKHNPALTAGQSGCGSVRQGQGQHAFCRPA